MLAKNMGVYLFLIGEMASPLWKDKFDMFASFETTKNKEKASVVFY